MKATNEELNAELDKIVLGLEEAYRKLVIFKREKNSPLIVVIDGKITELNPFDAPDTTKYKRGKNS